MITLTKPLLYRALLPIILNLLLWNLVARREHNTRFPDIIIADMLTSLARPLADLALLLTRLLQLHPPAQAALAILVNSLPCLLRLKQCLNDLVVSPANSPSPWEQSRTVGTVPCLSKAYHLYWIGPAWLSEPTQPFSPL